MLLLQRAKEVRCYTSPAGASYISSNSITLQLTPLLCLDQPPLLSHCELVTLRLQISTASVTGRSADVYICYKMLDTGHRRIFCPSAEQLFRRHCRGCGSRSATAGLGTSEHQIAAIIGISGNTSLASINTGHSAVQLRGRDESLGWECL